MRFVPKSNHIVMEVIYNVEIPDEVIPDNGRYMSIDLGIDNLATITYNFGESPVIINGKGLKSINQYYNKYLAYYQSIAKIHNGLHRTNRIDRLTSKRHHKISDGIHKISRYIVNEAIRHNVCVIVIGYNKEWKQSSEMSKKVNQKFIQMPFNQLIQRIEYKAQEVGIKVILTEESYTSGTSFLDQETPAKEFYNKHRRIHRGLFKSNIGGLINSDVNGSLQIMKKVFPNAYDSYGIEGVVLYPVKVNVY